MIYLTKIHHWLDMSRFYTLDVQPDLFGEWVLYREWGRIGQAGQVRRTYYPGQEAALAALSEALRRRKRRGYIEHTA